MLSVVIFVCAVTLIQSRGLKEEFSWTRINYAWPGGHEIISRGSFEPILFPGEINYNRRTTTTKPNADKNVYIYENNIPMGANVWQDKLFITVPRRRVGVPSSLNFVWINGTERENVPLIPYPDWDTNLLGNYLQNRKQQKIVSVYRVAVDPCDRLWFVDTGIIETLGNPRQVQPTTLVIIDLKTDRIIKRHMIPEEHLRTASGLASVTVDVTKNTCDQAYAYIPDLGGYSVIVYSLKEDRSWRVNHNYFAFEPLHGDFEIGGHQFQWNDGIFSIALSNVKRDGFRDAYFHSMAGANQYRVSTKIFRNQTAATRSHHGSDFEFIGSKGDSYQTSTCDLAQSRGILFLGLVNRNALGCWNIKTPLSDLSIVHKDDKKMIYPSDVKISDEKVIVLTNTMPVFLYGRLNYDQINFRVWVQTVKMAIKGTKCDV